MIAKNFFVVKGIGFSDNSKVNAFDSALISAGLVNVNLVPVSSIIPPNAKEIKPCKLSSGSIVYTVLSRIDGENGDELSAGLAWGWAEDKTNRIGLVVTAQQKKIDDKEMEKKLTTRLSEMAENRHLKLSNCKIHTVNFKVTNAKFGCGIVAFIYCF